MVTGQIEGLLIFPDQVQDPVLADGGHIDDS